MCLWMLVLILTKPRKILPQKCVHEFVQKLLCDDDWSWVRLCNRITVLARTTCLQNPDKLTLGYWTLKKKMTDSVNDWSIFGLYKWSTEYKKSHRIMLATAKYMKIAYAHPQISLFVLLSIHKYVLTARLTERPHTPQRNTQKAKSRILMKLGWVY